MQGLRDRGSALIDGGYAVLRIEPNPFRDKAPGVIEICSVSDCVSHRPDNWIQSWLHNDFGWFNTAHDAAHIIPAGEEDSYRLFAYRVHPELYRRGNPVEIDLPENLDPEPVPANFRTIGFDAVSRSETTTVGFDCSPLSCNDMAAEMPANLHCLFSSLDDAIAAAKRFSVEQPEPGDYFVVEVLEGRLTYDEPPAWEFGELAPDALAGAPPALQAGYDQFHYDKLGALSGREAEIFRQMQEQPAIAQLKHDVVATLGARFGERVEARARLLLPFSEWPGDTLATKLVGDVQQEIHDTFVDTAWPHCPSHPNHPLWYDNGAWRCNQTGDAVAALGDLDAVLFNDAITGLRRGDFDRLAPLFTGPEGEPALILRWHREGRFADHATELAEAVTNACFLGRDQVAGALIAQGVDFTAGSATGMDALHWAVNRGKLDTVRMLLALGAPLETVNMHGTTALGTAVWSAINEPWWGSAQTDIIKVLLDTGANIEGAGYPTGNAEIDRLLESYGASR
jgi:hypothetical protein